MCFTSGGGCDGFHLRRRVWWVSPPPAGVNGDSRGAGVKGGLPPRPDFALLGPAHDHAAFSEGFDYVFDATDFSGTEGPRFAAYFEQGDELAIDEQRHHGDAFYIDRAASHATEEVPTHFTALRFGEHAVAAASSDERRIVRSESLAE